MSIETEDICDGLLTCSALDKLHGAGLITLGAIGDSGMGSALHTVENTAALIRVQRVKR